LVVEDVAVKIKKCKVKVKMLEVVEVVGPASQRKAAIDQLYAEGYTSVRSGPYTNARMWPEYDWNRFKIVAEKDL